MEGKKLTVIKGEAFGVAFKVERSNESLNVCITTNLMKMDENINIFSNEDGVYIRVEAEDDK